MKHRTCRTRIEFANCARNSSRDAAMCVIWSDVMEKTRQTMTTNRDRFGKLSFDSFWWWEHGTFSADASQVCSIIVTNGVVRLYSECSPMHDTPYRRSESPCHVRLSLCLFPGHTRSMAHDCHCIGVHCSTKSRHYIWIMETWTTATGAALI